MKFDSTASDQEYYVAMVMFLYSLQYTVSVED